MKFLTLALLCILLCAPAGLAQADAAPHIAGVGPYPNAAPGQIVELRVEGIDARLTSPQEGDALRILLTQDGSTRAAAARTATPVMVRERRPGAAAGSPVGMKSFTGLTFVVPKGLRAGEAEVVVSYRGRRSAPFKLNVVERPLRPVVGGAPVKTISPASLPAPTPAGSRATRANLGLKFERGARAVELHVRPLTDPEDPEAGVHVRFKQGGAFYDADARVVHREGGREGLPNGGFRLMPPRDVLEVDVPETLAPGEAELEITLRAAGRTGEAALVPVTVTDAERAFESPKDAAPRMLAVSPRRLGTGQALLISVERRRALDPDPSKVEVVFETPDGAWSHKARPETNSAARDPNTPPDAPVLLVVRVPKQLNGDVRVRLRNPAREEYAGAASEPAQIEVLAEPFAPEVAGAAEANESEVSQLRRLTAAQSPDPRLRPIYDPSARYASIRGTGFDPNPKFLRVRMEQEGRSVTLERADFAVYGHGAIIVRVPKEFRAGAVRVTVENRGASGYSAPAAATLQLSERR